MEKNQENMPENMPENNDFRLLQAEEHNQETNKLLEMMLQQNEENKPEPMLETMIQQNEDTKKTIEDNGNKVAEAVKELKPAINAAGFIASFMEAIRGEKGTDGKDGKDGKDGETPVKGKDYFTNKEIKEIITSVLNQIEKPKDGKDGKDGYTPIKGKDYFDGKDGKDGKDGSSFVLNDKVIKEIIKKLPKIPKEKSSDELITDLKGKISYNDLKDLPTIFKGGGLNRITSVSHDASLSGEGTPDSPLSVASGGGHVIEDNGTPLTQRTNLNFIGATVADNPGNDSTDVTITGVGTSGFSGFSGTNGTSGFSGFSGSNGANGVSGFSGFSGSNGISGFSGFSGIGTSGFSGTNGVNGTSGYSGFSGIGTSGFSGFSGAGGGQSGFSGFSGIGTSGFSGFSGNSGYSGFSGTGGGQSGYSGYSGSNGTSGFSGFSGISGFSGNNGTNGISGFSGFSGVGTSGFSGFSGVGTSGFSGTNGTSGFSGINGTSGFSGFSGTNGTSGFSGFSGTNGNNGASGFSGFSGIGTSGFSGINGATGTSGFSGFSGSNGAAGTSGFSGFSGSNGSNGTSGFSGINGAVGTSGFSGFSGSNGATGTSGFSGFSGKSGFSGFSGIGTSGFSGFSGIGTSGFSGFSGAGGGTSGFSGFSGIGTSGFSGFSGAGGGTSGYSGYSGYSGTQYPWKGAYDAGTTYTKNDCVGYNGSGYVYINNTPTSGNTPTNTTYWNLLVEKGTSGFSGFSGLSGFSGNSTSGFSGFSGIGTSGYSGYSGVIGNLTGPITSVGSATSIASQTGTGTKFVVDTSPTLITPNIGVATGTSLSLGGGGLFTGSVFNAYGSVAGTFQNNIQNGSDDTSASTDLVMTADTGTNLDDYMDIGINSSTYNDANYTIGGALSGYVYSYGGDLTLGTGKAGKIIKLHTGGTLISNLVATIDDNGLLMAAGKNIRLQGATSGTVTIQTPTVAGTVTLTLPSTTGTLMNNPMTASGDLIYGGTSGAPTRLVKGTDGNILKQVAGIPAWVAGAASDVGLGNVTNDAQVKKAASSTSGAIPTWNGTGGDALNTGGLTAPSGTIVGTSDTQTLTNKRWTMRTGTTSSSATPTINTDNVDMYLITAQAADITSFTTNLSGTPTEGQKLWIAITGTAARAITWGTSFENGFATLPTTTVGTARIDIIFVWNSVTSKWRCMGAGPTS